MSAIEVQSAAIEEIDCSAEDVAETIDVLQQFREMIHDLDLDDHRKSDAELMRWIRARAMDLNGAEKMLRRSIEWRKEDKIDTVLNWDPPQHFLVDFPFQISGFDHDGDQFGVVTYSKWNIQSFLDAVPVNKAEVHMRYFWKALEIVKQIMIHHSTEEKQIYSGIVIVDLEGLAISQFIHRYDILAVILDATRKYEANYPGFLKKAVVVNTPKLFTMLWSLMTPFLSEETLSCVDIYGYYDDWRTVLRDLLPHDQLPSRYGGANTSTKNFDQSLGYRVIPSLPVTLDEKDLKPTNVPAGQKLDLDYEIVNPGTVLSWAFKTDGYDIGFGVFYCSDGGEVEVVDFCRVDSHILLQKGSYKCDNPGKYIVRFDNISSWITPKSLHYCVKMNV